MSDKKDSDVCMRVLRKIQAKTIAQDELGKAKSFCFFSISRPHMRGFHASWACFFVAFTSWFSIQPLIPTISKELGLSNVKIAHSGIASISATIFARICVGPLCDKFGPRRTMSALLILGSIPLALSGIIRDVTGLLIIRLFIGILGGAFIPCQFWTSAMFNVKIIGTANALVGGWGNLGGGVTFILMPALFEIVKACGAGEYLAWKVAIAIPAALTLGLGILIIWTTDDCPQGHWSQRKLKTMVLTDALVKNNRGEEGKAKDTKEKKTEEAGREVEPMIINVDSTQIANSGWCLCWARGIRHKIVNQGVLIIWNSDDCPQGHWFRRKLPPMELTDALVKSNKGKGKAKYTNGKKTEEEGREVERMIINVESTQIANSDVECNGSQKNNASDYFWMYTTVFLLLIQYGLCFGVELAVNTVMNVYLLYRFKREDCTSVSERLILLPNVTNITAMTVIVPDTNDCSILTQNTASLIASLFGLMNLFASAVAGVFSDQLRKYFAIPGLLFAQLVCLAGEGVMLTFSQMTTVPSAIMIMVVFSIFVQMSEGITFSLVPYVHPRRLGIVSGLIGAGGNAGAIVFNTIWVYMVDSDPSRWFWTLGLCVLCGSSLTLLIPVQRKRIWNLRRQYKTK